jgi:virginiamycin B lyase
MISTSGSVTEYPVGSYNHQPYQMTVDSDGNIWFTAYLGNSIARITTSGT